MAPQKKRGNLSEHISRRNTIMQNISAIDKFVRENGDSLSPDELDCRLEIVELYFQQALEQQTSIEEYECDLEKERRFELEDMYCKLKVKIKSLMRHNSDVKVEKGTRLSKAPENLPKLALPTFSGKYIEFPNFIRIFRTLIHDETRLAIIEKYNHLVSCLSGSALHAVQALDLIEENYPIALQLLEDRYDNKHLLCQEHIKELFNLNKVQKGSAEQLRQLVDTTSAHFNALSSLLTFEEICNAFVVHLAMSALDNDSKMKLEESFDYNNTLKWSTCAKTLINRSQILENREINMSPANTQKQTRYNKQNHNNSKTTLSVIQQNNCKCCNQNVSHAIWLCPEFIKSTPLQRFNTIKRLMLCINCFSSQHTMRQCKSSMCKKCGKAHHTMLHRNEDKINSSPQQQGLSHNAPSFTPQQPTTSNYTPPSEYPSVSNSTSATTMIGQQSKNVDVQNDCTILATAMINIVDNYGNKHLARVLLDSASQLNFITQKLASKLNLAKTKIETVIDGIGESRTRAKYEITANITSCISDFSTTLRLLILPAITGLQPHVKINTDTWNIPEHIQLADSKFHIPQKVDLLIGADVFFELLKGSQLKISPRCPILTNTVFGWIVSGRCKSFDHATSLISKQISATSDINLELLVKQFWQLEKVPEFPHKLSKEQSECEEHFKQSFKRTASGRFQVRLPFKVDSTVLGDSKSMAIRRFYNLEKRLDTHPELQQAYTEFLHQYEAEGHMTNIQWPTSLAGWFIMPHHCVWRPQKSTTKCRVVFDGSAKTSNNIALNDIIKVGPVVQKELFDILLHFRLHKYALMGDICAMYRQIFVNEEDCKVQNIIWRTNPFEELKLYRLNTVTYGTASAPYLATRCLVQLAYENEKTFPNASRIIKDNFYVDDLITGGNSLHEIQTIKNEVEAILSQAGFSLRKWFSNHQQFLEEIPESEREKTIKINDVDVVKTLGVIWDASTDCFKFSYTAENYDNIIITKRKVLSEMSKLFDPLGLIKPVIVKTKIFLQELWLKNLNWDEPIPAESANAWITFVQQLVNLNCLKIPRFILVTDSKIELHGFADASTRAYGCCFYLRCTDTAGNIQVSLLTSRSKVAPISTVRSLPCLELCGAHLLTQLFQKVRNLCNFSDVVFWSDSVIVLHWLVEHASNFNTFVANRVAFIQEHTGDFQWRYVPSGSNPADLVSRGTTVTELSSTIWFTGPSFLKTHTSSWPKHPKEKLNPDFLERRVPKTILLAVRNDILEFVNSRSNFIKTCRTIAYIQRFCRNCRSRNSRNSSESKIITASELDEAFLRIITLLQKIYFNSEISSLHKFKEVEKTSSLKALNPFIENDNNELLLKVGGRLGNSKLPYLVKCPIILPKNNNFIQTYVRHLHTSNSHAGAQSLVSLIQQRFWIIGAREYARKVVKHCILCFKYRPKLLSQIMGNLPEHRVTPVKPFTHCGVDFCGPITTTVRIRSRPKYKSYIALFVCFVTRAVHMEVVSALTSEAFIAALKRFIGRRGLCTTLYCDNATNFIGARNMLRELKEKFTAEQFQNDITSWCAMQQISFKHIPPRSPHFGGLWEASIKSAKTLLYKSMQSALFTFEELSTLVTQIEGILNSRPLTVLSNDPSDERVLTPAHFLNQSNAECIAEPTIPFNQTSLVNKWQQITAIQQHFWNRWRKEYLILLQQRYKWTSSMPNISVGALVLIHEDNVPPQKWVMGRVTQTFPGPDGRVRVAEVRTPTNLLKRSIVRLAVIPIDTGSVETS